MSRVASGDVVVVKPSSNIYTVLAVVGVVVSLASFIILCMRCSAVFGPKFNLFSWQ